MKLKKYMILILICVLGCMLIVAGCGKSDSKKEPKEPTTVTIIDSARNEVKILHPVNRIITLTADNTELAIVLGDEDKIVGVSDEAVNYAEIGDKLTRAATVGHFREPNLEKIAVLKPDVVIGYETSIEKGIKDKLESMGIPFIVCECNKFETFEKDVELMGRILGKEDKAKEFLTFHHSVMNMIKERTKNIRPDQRTQVYLSGGWGKEPCVTFGKESDINLYLNTVGAINIASELPGNKITVSPEWVLTQDNIEVIIDHIASTQIKPTTEPLIEVKKIYMSDPVWAKTTAAREGRVHIMGWRVYKGLRFSIGLLYCAKWCHPNLFNDIDPEKYHSEYMQKFLGLELQNVWGQ